MLDFVFLVFLGLGISMVLVRRSSRKGMDLELTWLQSLKVVLVRGAVALGLGFGIGRLVLMGMQYGFLSESVLSESVLSESVLREHALVSVAVVLICGLGSFVAFQWIIGRISGRSISVVSVIKAVMYESGYFVLSMLILLVILVLFGLAYETFF
ncbi:TPA: hypothetical protein ACH7KE_003236 [Escherichia coli]|nr:hypothetical protein [Salmonella enterica]EBO2263886.1 hypothetical protein [Salmonella enterica subsp. enterica serovar Typhimurium]EBV8636812.1 hypothetical protein [Salmonella enterica subsp. enterica serovar Typhimurium var. 5-]EBZ0002238.1 hypothetical protein [Salmonella enterica subsp. enterica serovar Heidelberg]HDQ1148719.1 hypothetical protein [Escherichia coli]